MENIEPDWSDTLSQVFNYAKGQGNSALNILSELISPRQAVPIYDDNGTLQEVREETLAERKARLYESKKLENLERTIGEQPVPGSWTEIGGEIYQELSDPANLLFFSGAGLAKETGKRFMQLVAEVGLVETIIETG